MIAPSATKLPSESARRRRLAVLTNLIAPYRVPLFEQFNEHFETTVFISGEEDNRLWHHHETGFRVRRSAGITLKRSARSAGRVHDVRYVHLNPGLLWELVRFRPDAVVTVEMGFRSLVALLYGTVSGTPTWVWWGGTIHTERGRARSKRLLRRVFARLTPRWISYGQSSTAYLVKVLGIDPGRVLQIQNCVDDRVFRSEGGRASLGGSRPRVLVVGQLIGRKGIEELLRATARVRQEGNVLSLTIAGTGPDAHRLTALAAELGVPDVHWLGHVPVEEMPSLYRAADALIFPTLEDVWGLVVNEALLCGTPVVCSIYAGCAEELVPPENRFDPTDPDEFADALRRVATGDIVPADRSLVKGTREIGDMILADIERRIGRPSGAGTHRAGGA